MTELRYVCPECVVFWTSHTPEEPCWYCGEQGKVARPIIGMPWYIWTTLYRPRRNHD